MQNTQRLHAALQLAKTADRIWTSVRVCDLDSIFRERDEALKEVARLKSELSSLWSTVDGD